MLYIRMNENEGIMYNDVDERYTHFSKDVVCFLKNLEKISLNEKNHIILCKKLLQMSVLKIENGLLRVNEKVLFQEKQNDIISPFVAYWLITNKCNFKCKHCCWANHSALDKELDFSECKNLIDQLVDLGIVRLSISGGEPLCEYDKLRGSVEYANKKGIKSICIATNGSLLNQTRINELIDSGVTEFQFSIDDVDAKLHNNQRQINNFEHIKGLTALIREKGCMVSAGVTINKKNLDRIQLIVEGIVRELGITKIKIVRYLPIVKDEYSADLELIEPQEIAMAISQMENLRNKYMGSNITVKIPSIAQVYGRFLKNHERLDSSCEALKVRMCIMADGKISPCPILSSLGVIVGDIRKDSVDDILTSAEAKKIIDWKGKQKCQESCEYYKFCGGGCIANSINYYDNKIEADKWCFKEYKNFI